MSGLSLWLVPEEAERARLDALIVELAARLHGPPFRAHLTLLPRLRGSESEALERAARLAARTPPVPLALARAAHKAAYYRSLYLEAERKPELLGALQRARRLFPGGPDDFRPHVSVAYGRVSSSIGDPAARALEERLALPLSVRGDRLEVWATRGDAARWHEIGGFALGS